jgi:hypothetical protein
MRQGESRGRRIISRAQQSTVRFVFCLITGYIAGYKLEAVMGTTSQTRALKNYRKRLNQRGMARFEVLGLSTDRELIRSLARRLADNSSEATEIRASMRQISGEPAKKGGILAALRRSPLVGADLNLAHPRIDGRKVNL